MAQQCVVPTRRGRKRRVTPKKKSGFSLSCVPLPSIRYTGHDLGFTTDVVECTTHLWRSTTTLANFF
jgi:hypothetical protein